jgi:hypothetical protein
MRLTPGSAWDDSGNRSRRHTGRAGRIDHGGRTSRCTPANLVEMVVKQRVALAVVQSEAVGEAHHGSLPVQGDRVPVRAPLQSLERQCRLVASACNPGLCRKCGDGKCRTVRGPGRREGIEYNWRVVSVQADQCERALAQDRSIHARRAEHVGDRDASLVEEHHDEVAGPGCLTTLRSQIRCGANGLGRRGIKLTPRRGPSGAASSAFFARVDRPAASRGRRSRGEADSHHASSSSARSTAVTSRCAVVTTPLSSAKTAAAVSSVSSKRARILGSWRCRRRTGQVCHQQERPVRHPIQ